MHRARFCLPTMQAINLEQHMERRLFLRVMGGGIITAASVSGCSSDYPDAALAPWQGPGNEPDLRRWALGYALLAPNPHNLQSWSVDLSVPEQITLWVEPTRLLPETDPPGRQILIGQGCFVELLRMALAERGVRAEVQAFPDGEPGPMAADVPKKPVARIRLLPGGQKDPLFAQVLRRHTDKNNYDTTRTVAPEALQTLRDAVAPVAVQTGGTVQADAVGTLRQLCWDASQVEILTPRTALESLKLLRIGPTEIEQHRDGISNNSPRVRIFNALGMVDRTQAPAPDSPATQQMKERFQGHSMSAMGFVWISTAQGRRIDALQAGHAYVRMQLAATALGLGIHPMSQALQEFPEMAPHYQAVHQRTLVQ
jgi:hypothetical protein